MFVEIEKNIWWDDNFNYRFNLKNFLENYNEILKNPSFLEKMSDGLLYKQLIKEISSSLKFNLLSEQESNKLLASILLEIAFENLEFIKPAVLFRKEKKENLTFSSQFITKTMESEQGSSFYTFICTIGEIPDKKVKELSDNGDVMESHLLNSFLAGVTEIVTEDFQRYLETEIEQRKLKRYSPGYRDWQLNEQKNLFEFVKYSEKLKVSLTDSYLMLPEKTTSGIIF